MEAKIKASDLRFGNLVAVYGIVCFVCKIQSDKVGVKVLTKSPQEIDDHLYEDIKPIELTEEWLLKMGFERKTEYIEGVGLTLYYENKNFPFKIYNDWKKEPTFRIPHLGMDVHFVHTLQNISFVISGSELTINEQK